MMKNYSSQIFKDNSNYIIFGNDIFDNSEIVNELLIDVIKNYNEVLYFNMSPYSDYCNFKMDINNLNKRIDIFSYFKSGIFTKSLDKHHEDVATFLNKICYVESTKWKNKILSKFLSDIYSSELRKDFSISLLEGIIQEIIDKSKIPEFYQIKKLLINIRKIQNNIPEDFEIDQGFKNKSQEARIILESLIMNPESSGREESLLKFNSTIYQASKTTIQYFSELLNGLRMLSKIDYESTANIKADQVNYFEGFYDYFYTEYVDMFLKNIIQMKKESDGINSKPFIFISGSQKEILKSTNMNKTELLQYCNVCFIVDDAKHLDKQTNALIEVKIYSEHNSNLNVSKKSPKTKFKDYNISSTFSPKFREIPSIVS